MEDNGLDDDGNGESDSVLDGKLLLSYPEFISFFSTSFGNISHSSTVKCAREKLQYLSWQ